MDNSQLINQDSGDYEYYTPTNILDLVKRLMGNIDLDPASSLEANKQVRAANIFTPDMEFEKGSLLRLGGGLEKRWFGRVWMNHPFARAESPCKPDCEKKICQKRGYHTNIFLPGNAHWINKLINEYENGDVVEACCITYASTSEKWFRPLLDYKQCFLYGRTNYMLPNGKIKKGNTKGSVVTYFGCDPKAFEHVFSQAGKVK